MRSGPAAGNVDERPAGRYRKGLMIRRTAIRFAALAGLLALLPASVMRTDWKLFRCRMDHVVRLEPCCPDDELAVESFVEGSGDAEDGCCDVSLIRADQSPFAAAARDGHIASAPHIVGLPAPVASARQPAVAAGWSPPVVVNTGPPVFLRVRALLI